MTWGLGWLAAYLVLAGMGLAISGLLALQSWEHRRFVKGACRQKPRLSVAPWAAVIVPVKGVDLELRQSLRALLNQDYPNYEVHFVGESRSDPAYQLIQSLIDEHPQRRVCWHAAGQAGGCGQKVHNLMHATRRLDSHIALVAFADSDACPPRNWLRCLAARLLQSTDNVGAVTGYRCCVPAEPRVSNYVLYGINAAVCSMLTAKARHNLLWGGSWIMQRAVFDSCRLRKAWQGTLSDDMVASRVIREAGKRVAFEPKIIVPSATDVGWGGLFEFLRRQFFMVRHYAPALWTGLLAAWTVSTVAFWSSAALSVWGAAAGAPWNWLPAGVAALLYALGVWRVAMRQDAARASVPQIQPQLAAAQRLELFGGPLLSLVGWIGLVSSALLRQVTWRGIAYRLGSDGRVRSVAHQPAPEPPGRRAA